MQDEAALASAKVFESYRRRLFGVAYRMLGSRVEAEDVVQDAYLRWHAAETSVVKNPEAWLVTAVTRLSIDRLRKLKLEREKYVGQWLPEPLINAPVEFESDSELAASLSMAFVTLLERLGPEERAAFLLHDVFALEYGEISSVLGRNVTACRQIVHRARQRVRGSQKRFAASPEEKEKILRTFAQAVEAKDAQTLLTLFTPDATWTGDGGGRTPASPQPIVGRERIVNLVMNLRSKFWKDEYKLSFVSINGEPGLCIRNEGTLTAALSFATDGTYISDVYVVLNPDKLAQAVSSPGLPGDGHNGAGHSSRE